MALDFLKNIFGQEKETTKSLKPLVPYNDIGEWMPPGRPDLAYSGKKTSPYHVKHEPVVENGMRFTEKKETIQFNPPQIETDFGIVDVVQSRLRSYLEPIKSAAQYLWEEAIISPEEVKRGKEEIEEEGFLKYTAGRVESTIVPMAKAVETSAIAIPKMAWTVVRAAAEWEPKLVREFWMTDEIWERHKESSIGKMDESISTAMDEWWNENINKTVGHESRMAIEILGDKQRQIVESIFDEKPGLSSYEEYVFTITAGTISLAESLGIMMITKNPTVASAFLGLLEGSDEYNNARAAGKTQEEAMQITAKSVVGTVVLEKLSLDQWVRTAGLAWYMRSLSRGSFETGQEATQTIYQNLVAKYGYDYTRNWYDGLWETVVGTAPGAFLLGIPQGPSSETRVIDKQVAQYSARDVGQQLESNGHNDIAQKVRGAGLRENYTNTKTLSSDLQQNLTSKESAIAKPFINNRIKQVQFMLDNPVDFPMATNEIVDALSVRADVSRGVVTQALKEIKNATELVKKQAAIDIVEDKARYRAMDISEEAKAKDSEALSTKILEELGDRESVSHQFIDDLTRRDDIKKQEVNIVQEVLNEYKEGEKIPVQEFKEKVQMQLLPLDTFDYGIPGEGGREYMPHEGVVLPGEQRGNIANYFERVYESPIKTSAGDIHFEASDVPNYFAHTRVEDMASPLSKPDLSMEEIGDLPFQEADKLQQERRAGKQPIGIRRIIEIQSDLFQRGRLEREVSDDYIHREDYKGTLSEKGLERKEEISKLQPYRNTWFERIIREEIHRDAQDGIKQLRFPTGETAMKIEGLGGIEARWARTGRPTEMFEDRVLSIADLKVGLEIQQGGAGEIAPWIITDVLEDGKFKAVQKNYLDESQGMVLKEDYPKIKEALESGDYSLIPSAIKETFDISGKIDTSNPVYIFYEKTIPQFLKRIHSETKKITDEQGITWWEIDITEKDKGPVMAFREAQGLKFDITTEQASEILNKLYDKDEVDFIFTEKEIIMSNGKPAWGKYYNSLIELYTRNGMVSSMAVYHEAVEAYMAKWVSPETRRELYDEAIKGRPGRTDAWANEYIADQFKEYIETGKTSVGAKLRAFFIKLRNHIASWVSKENRMIKLFQDIEARKRPVDQLAGLDFRKLTDKQSRITGQAGLVLEAISRKEIDEKEGMKDVEKLMKQFEATRKPAEPTYKEGEKPSDEQLKLFEEVVKHEAREEYKDEIDEIIAGKQKMRIPLPGGSRSEWIEGLGKKAFRKIFRKESGRRPDDLASELGMREDDLRQKIMARMAASNMIKEEVMTAKKFYQKGKKMIRRQEEFRRLTDKLKEKIEPFYRPSRRRTSSMFRLLGNKDATVPLFASIFKRWVGTGVDTIVEPYGGAFTLGMHSIPSALNAGLKEFHTNIFDNEKYLITKAVQGGKLEKVKGLVDDAMIEINRTIIGYAKAEPKVKKVLDDFMKEYPDSYIGSKQWMSYIRDTKIAREAHLARKEGEPYYEEYKMFADVFQAAAKDIFNRRVVDLNSAVVNTVIKKMGRFSGEEQTFITTNGFRQIEGTIYDKYGMINGLEDLNAMFELAKKKEAKIVIYSEDGAKFAKRFEGRDPNTVGYFMDPPYIYATEVYTKGVDDAGTKASLDKFTSGQKFYDSHKGMFDAVNKGSKIALTNDIDQEYLDLMVGEEMNIYAYKEHTTQTSLVVSYETGVFVDEFLKESEKVAMGEREEISRIKELKTEKELSNVTVSRIRRAVGIQELKNATPEKLEAMIDILESLEHGDKMLTDLQKTSLKNLIDTYGGKESIDLLTQREVTEMFGEDTDILQGRISGKIAAMFWPGVDIKEEHPIIRRIMDRADQHLRQANKEVKRRSHQIAEMKKKALKSEKASKRDIQTKLFMVMSGAEGIDLTPAERANIVYMKNFYKMAKDKLQLEKFRKYYVPHIEAGLMEKIVERGVLGAIKSYRGKKDANIPLGIMLALDNIIGSEKFFRFALEREGGTDPTMDVWKIMDEYSQLYEAKLALDEVLPEAQAAQQLLLQRESAIFIQKFLQNLKGRGMDHEFRHGKSGWMAKATDRIIDLGYIRLLGLNYWSAFKNIVGGETNSFVYQSMEEENRLLPGLMKDFKLYLTGKQRLITHPKTAVKFISNSGVLDGSYAEMARSTIIQKGRRLSDIILYGGTEIGEYEIRGSYLLGELTDTEWQNVLEGKKDPITTERFRKIVDDIAITQGVYTKIDSPLFTQTWYGRMIMQFGRWKITNLFLVRRIAKGATREIKAGNYGGANTRRLIRMLATYGVMMYMSWELGKRGHKKAEKIARAGAELINNIFTFVPDMENAIRNNPTLETIGSVIFTMRELAAYIGVAEEPYPVKVHKTLDELYIAGLEMFKQKKKEKTEREKLYEKMYGKTEVKSTREELYKKMYPE